MPVAPIDLLSTHFALSEFTQSQMAARRCIDNFPPPDIYENLKRLAAVMEKVRIVCDHRPVIITSGYRCLEINKLVGGSVNSAHVTGLAADFIVPTFGNPLAVCQRIAPYMVEWGIDQLIMEFHEWCHLGLREEAPRHHRLTINERGTREGFG